MGLSHHQVVERWGMAHKLPLLFRRWLDGQLTSRWNRKHVSEIIERWRERLWDLSWYMKELNYNMLAKRTKKIAALGISGKVDLKAELYSG
ncbi:hypothetical protein [Vibrio neptunius]|uniref:hypothetical protein n=1 Tax=Vibrio neptunius TaxID=170651 RepID=UPI003CE58DC6